VESVRTPARARRIAGGGSRSRTPGDAPSRSAAPRGATGRSRCESYRALLMLMLRQSRTLWLARSAIRTTRGEVGSAWGALVAGALAAVIPSAIFTAFDWKTGTAIAVVGAAIGYVVNFLRVAIARFASLSREGHPYFRTQISVTEHSLDIRLTLKDGAPPQGVNELAVVVRKRGKDGYGILLPGVAGTRTIDRVGMMPPHALYPDHFPGAPLLEPGTWQIIWSDVKGKRRVEFLFAEVEYKPATPD
jgi:hypothetical protein